MTTLENSTCSYCNLFPAMQASPAHFCSVCVLALRKKALSDRMLGMLADKGQRDPAWRIEAQWGADSHH